MDDDFIEVTVVVPRWVLDYLYREARRVAQARDGWLAEHGGPSRAQVSGVAGWYVERAVVAEFDRRAAPVRAA